MKAKRILSILLTGSMLLSLLPVSALAAAPVFDAPALTTAKKAASLVQEADASHSTEEEAATRSSRDLDAENGTAESITTIQLNAAGKPASEVTLAIGTTVLTPVVGCTMAFLPCSPPRRPRLKAHCRQNSILVKMPNLTAAPSAVKPAITAPSPTAPSKSL